MKIKWYAAKRKKDKRWHAYKWEKEEPPKFKRGWEYLGPFDDLLTCWMETNKYQTGKLV